MEIEFDQAKNAKNAEKHGLTLDRFADLDLDAGIIEPDTRHDYAEDRYVVTAPLEGRLHVACFCIRGEAFRIISFRKANRREVRAMKRPELRPPMRPKMRAPMRPPMRPLTDEEGEVRELTVADFRQMKPVREAMPELIEAMTEFRRKLGRPKVAAPKVHIGFRLAPDVVESVKASGPGYNTRVEQALRKAGFGAMRDGDLEEKDVDAKKSKALKAKAALTKKRRAEAQAAKSAVSNRRA